MLEFSNKAILEFQRILKDKEGKAIRIFSMGSGCCGPSVGMDIVDEGQREDETIEREGLRVHIERKASIALDGVTIDFSSEGDQKGFLLKHPAGGGCCG